MQEMRGWTDLLPMQLHGRKNKKRCFLQTALLVDQEEDL